MNAIIYAVEPNICEKIAKERCRLLIGKILPKLKTPFKVYIYCKSIKRMPLAEYVKIHKATGGRIDEWHDKVIGEFICDGIVSHCEMANADIAEQQGCIKRELLLNISGGKELYGLHISNLVLYDQSKEITDFYTRPEKSDYDYCSACPNHETPVTQLPCSECVGDELDRKYLSSPPRPLCYVEELTT